MIVLKLKIVLLLGENENVNDPSSDLYFDFSIKLNCDGRRRMEGVRVEGREGGREEGRERGRVGG